MRSEIISDKHTAGNERVIPGDKQEIPLNGALLYEELDKLDKEFFGELEKPKEGAPLAWKTMKSDNYLIRSLKQMAGLFAHAVKKEAEATEKKVKKARRVFYGR